MAYPSSKRSSWRKLKPSQVLPLWTPAHSDTANLIAESVFHKLGITDIRSYWHKLQGIIVLSVIVCACIGASNYGLQGFFLGGLLGIGAPAAAIFLAVVVVLAAILLGVYCLAWVAIYYIACWLLSA
jgi:hypothetical protein